MGRHVLDGYQVDALSFGAVDAEVIDFSGVVPLEDLGIRMMRIRTA
jgi:hypothetical protein